MSILRSISVSVRLWLSLVPLMSCVALLAAHALVDQYSTYHSSRVLMGLKDICNRSSDVIHEMQRERGSSALFLGSQGRQFGKELQVQRRHSDAAVATLVEAVGSTDLSSLGSYVSGSIKAVHDGVERVIQVRGPVDAMALSPAEATNDYTSAIAKLLDLVGDLAMVSNNSEINLRIAAYLALMAGKERGGLERAIGSIGFATGNFSIMLHNKFSALIGEQDAFFETFIRFATLEQRQVLKRVLGSADYAEFQHMRELPLQVPAGTAITGLEAGDWFKASTVRMDRLREVEIMVGRDIDVLVETAFIAARRAFYSVLLLTCLGGGLTLWAVVLVARSIIRPLRRLNDAMGRLAQGDVEIGATMGRHADEVGQMADAILVLRANLVDQRRLEVVHVRAEERQRILEENSRIMGCVIKAIAGMFRTRVMQEMLNISLLQLVEIAGGNGDAMFCVRELDHNAHVEQAMVVCGYGRWARDVANPIQSVLNESDAQNVDRVITTGQQYVDADRIIVPLAVSGRWQGAVLLSGPIDQNSGLLNSIDLFRMVMLAALENYYLFDQLRRSHKVTVIALADLAEHRDTDTGEHVLRVARLSSEIAWELRRTNSFPDQISDLFVEGIGPASMLHDLGKVGVPDSILKKPGRLDPEERRIMETHAIIGAHTLERAKRLVLDSSSLDLGYDAALGHHEWYDGTGYPNHIKGTDIPLAARIVAVADVFDALVTPRVYKPAWRFEDAVAHMNSSSGAQFDPVVIQAFQAVIDKWVADLHICWTPEMSVGDELLDEDHRRLIRLINQLASADERGDRSMVESVLDELIQYTVIHFVREEEYMEQNNYFQLDRHRIIHAILVKRVGELRRRLSNGLPSRLNEDFITFLNSWLTNHILYEDKQYHLFMKLQRESEPGSETL